MDEKEFTAKKTTNKRSKIKTLAAALAVGAGMFAASYAAVKVAGRA